MVIFGGIIYKGYNPSRSTKRLTERKIPDEQDSHGFIELSGNVYEYFLWPSRPLIYSDASSFCSDRNTR